MSGNYQLVYYHAKNMRFIGILAYPKKVLDYKIFNDHATFSHISHKLCHAFLTM